MIKLKIIAQSTAQKKTYELEPNELREVIESITGHNFNMFIVSSKIMDVLKKQSELVFAAMPLILDFIEFPKQHWTIPAVVMITS